MVFRFGNSLSELDFINGVTQLYVTDEDKLTRTLFKDFVSTINAYIDEEEFVHSKGIFGHHHISNNNSPNSSTNRMDMVKAEYTFATSKEQSFDETKRIIVILFGSMELSTPETDGKLHKFSLPICSGYLYQPQNITTITYHFILTLLNTYIDLDVSVANDVIIDVANATVTLCRLGFPTRPDFEVGVSRGSVCLSRGELGIRRG